MAALVSAPPLRLTIVGDARALTLLEKVTTLGVQSELVAEQDFDLKTQLRHLRARRMPDDAPIDSEICRNQDVAEGYEPRPRDVRSLERRSTGIRAAASPIKASF